MQELKSPGHFTLFNPQSGFSFQSFISMELFSSLSKPLLPFIIFCFLGYRALELESGSERHVQEAQRGRGIGQPCPIPTLVSLPSLPTIFTLPKGRHLWWAQPRCWHFVVSFPSFTGALARRNALRPQDFQGTEFRRGGVNRILTPVLQRGGCNFCVGIWTWPEGTQAGSSVASGWF